jgi:hypothetical protein
MRSSEAAASPISPPSFLSGLAPAVSVRKNLTLVMERFEARLAAARLDPMFQATAGERKLFLTASSGTHHAMEPSRKQSSWGTNILARSTSSQRPSSGAQSVEPAAEETAPSEGAIALKLDELSSLLGAIGSGQGVDDQVILKLTRVLREHANLSRGSLERERNAHQREVVQNAMLRGEMQRLQDELARQRASESDRIQAAVEAERQRCHAQSAEQLAGALFSAEVRANDEIEQLKAQQKRQIEALKP